MENRWGIEIKERYFDISDNMEYYVDLAPIFNEMFGADIVDKAEYCLSYVNKSEAEKERYYVDRTFKDVIESYEKRQYVDFGNVIILELKNGKKIDISVIHDKITVQIGSTR